MKRKQRDDSSEESEIHSEDDSPEKTPKKKIHYAPRKIDKRTGLEFQMKALLKTAIPAKRTIDFCKPEYNGQFLEKSDDDSSEEEFTL